MPHISQCPGAALQHMQGQTAQILGCIKLPKIPFDVMHDPWKYSDNCVLSAMFALVIMCAVYVPMFHARAAND